MKDLKKLLERRVKRTKEVLALKRKDAAIKLLKPPKRRFKP
ncbi:unnamed protein product [marine sediment metagenome]|uniref:Uncharacterized protein n=1 Tax=marine sediment metagenome TaxID=412755 RepID=X1BQ49_9ZZZZ